MASDDNSREMFFRHREGLEKYAYFLLAAAGSAVAFAVQKADGLTLRWNVLALAGSALAWILSFYFGCKRLSALHNAMDANYRYLRMGEEVQPELQQLPEFAEVRGEILKETTQYLKRSYASSIAQFRWLIAGALLFIAWRIWEILARTFADSWWAR